jgi:hypothetical protein
VIADPHKAANKFPNLHPGLPGLIQVTPVSTKLSVSGETACGKVKDFAVDALPNRSVFANT